MTLWRPTHIWQGDGYDTTRQLHLILTINILFVQWNLYFTKSIRAYVYILIPDLIIVGPFHRKKKGFPCNWKLGCFLGRPRLSFSSPYHYLPLLCSYNIICNNGFHLCCFRICCVVLHVLVLTGMSTLLRVHLKISIGSGLWRTLLLRLPVPDPLGSGWTECSMLWSGLLILIYVTCRWSRLVVSFCILLSDWPIGRKWRLLIGLISSDVIVGHVQFVWRTQYWFCWFLWKLLDSRFISL